MAQANSAPKPEHPRKPGGMKWETFADHLIRQAARTGAFDNLPGAGKPIPDLDKPFDVNWWVRGLVKREGLSITTAEVELKRTIDRRLAEIMRYGKEDAVRTALRELNAIIRKANATNTSGPMTTVACLNEDRLVREWRDQQPREAT